MPYPIELQCQKVIISFGKDKITLSPRPTGKKGFSIIDLEGDDTSEIIATDYYHTSELLAAVSQIAAIDKSTTIESQLIQDKTVIDGEGDKKDEIPAVHTQILTFPQIIDKNKFNQLLQLFVDNKLIHAYEKTTLVAMYETEHPCEKPQQLSAEELFRKSLAHISTQATMLKAAGDAAAASAATTLRRELTSAYDTFQGDMLKMPYVATTEQKEKPFLAFQASCDTAIQKAKETLKNYWNFKTIFLNLSVAIATLGVGYLALELYNYNQGNPLLLFKPYADGTVEKQLNLDELTNNAQKILI